MQIQTSEPTKVAADRRDARQIFSGGQVSRPVGMRRQFIAPSKPSYDPEKNKKTSQDNAPSSR